MVFITIVTGAYKPTYILGASHCSHSVDFQWNRSTKVTELKIQIRPDSSSGKDGQR
jgi:hypothetical protein